MILCSPFARQQNDPYFSTAMRKLESVGFHVPHLYDFNLECEKKILTWRLHTLRNPVIWVKAF